MVTIIFWLPNGPMAQAYLLLFLNLFFMVTLVTGRPYGDLSKQVAAVSNEIMILRQVVILIVFTTNKQTAFLSLNQGMILGWVFIGFILLGLMMNGLIAVFTIIINSLNKKKKPRRIRRRDKLRGNNLSHRASKIRQNRATHRSIS